jgi:MFS family permease
MSCGQLLFFSAPAEGFELFSISSIMLSLAVMPLILSKSAQPSYIRAPQLFGVKQLFSTSPLGVAGSLAAGLMGGAYWGLTAVFVLRMGYSSNAVAWFMAASLIGGLFSQWPLGVLSDHINRRYVIILAASLICVSSAALSLMAMWEVPAEIFGIGPLIAIGAIFGIGFHPLYSLCMAHANDFVEPENFVRASSSLQFVQGIGAIIGPMLAGVLMYLGGYGMLFAYISILSALFILYTVRRMAENRIPPEGRFLPFHIPNRADIFGFFTNGRYRE